MKDDALNGEVNLGYYRALLDAYSYSSLHTHMHRGRYNFYVLLQPLASPRR